MTTRKTICRCTTVLLAATLLICGCKTHRNYPGRRTEKNRTEYHQLNEQMLQMDSTALRTIAERMATATDSNDYYDYHLMYGRHYLLTAHPDSLLPYVRRTTRYVSSVHPTARTRGLGATALSAVASYLYLLHRDIDSTITLYRQAYKMMVTSDMLENTPDLSANLADAYVEKNRLAEAAHWYRHAIVLADSLQLTPEKSITLYMGLGRIYTTLGDYASARHYYEMTEEHYDKILPNMQSYFLNNYGNYFYYTGDYDNALRMFRRLKSHLEKYEMTGYFDMYLCKVNMADAMLNLGMLDSAKVYVGEADTYFKENQIEVGQHYANTIRIGIALKEHRYDEIERIVKGEGPLHSNAEMQGIRNKYLKEYYAARGDYRNAYLQLCEEVSTKDSTDSYRQHMLTVEIITRLSEDTMRLHHQLAMSEREVRYAKSQEALYTLVLLLIIVVLLIIAWLAYEHRRRLKNQMDMLALRLTLARQRISPHFVFNILNSRISKTDKKEADTLVNLARIIRANLDMSQKTFVTLSEELKFVREYVELERQLIGEDFTFTEQTPPEEEMDGVMIPSMLIQIMVENAIIHGLKGLKGEKRLSITVETDDETTTICVADNGPGFDVRQYQQGQSRTGLNIIRHTLAVINEENPKHKMVFNIRNNNGCEATISIPRSLKLTN